ncbi:uncharacterized protein LOC126748196 [Anthonomus grandis grandis]|uniref:uncharacterized protein LOC126748196 n=1 Tax=Anthonomus grandis grandis TaxID=2921223 RepID=UPI0021657E01|nr:uncharacterized protein LOC126748196 [Anthonomus grandis grandis]
MDFTKKEIKLKIRHFDLSEDPEPIDKILTIHSDMDYKLIEAELFKICEATPERHVLKIRNPQNCLIPISFLVEEDDPYFVIDVATISYFAGTTDKNTKTPLQDAYIECVGNKIKSLESRISKAELYLPELEYKREAHMEDTVSALLNKMQFLNRRYDELHPNHKKSSLAQEVNP